VRQINAHAVREDATCLIRTAAGARNTQKPVLFHRREKAAGSHMSMTTSMNMVTTTGMVMDMTINISMNRKNPVVRIIRLIRSETNTIGKRFGQ
jgi:hypothetical protein